MTFVKVYEKYTLVIPKKIREAFGIKSGDIIEIKQEGDKIVLMPFKKSEVAVEKTHGIVKWKKGVEKGSEAGYRKMGGG